MNALITARGITKHFGATKALDGVDLDVFAGEVHVLLGENGAGKSTLVKVLAGIHDPDDGTIERNARLAVIHQELALVPELSVAENLFLNRLPRRFGLVDRAAMRRRAPELLDRVGLRVHPDAKVRDLGIAQQQMVEIARALDQDAGVLILDEPTAVLTGTETDRLLEIMAQLRDNGVGLVFITHHLDEIQRVADRITVLRDGRSVGVLGPRATTRHMIELMVGRPIDEQYPREQQEAGEPLLRISGLTRSGAFEDVTIEVHAGEVVGVAGLVGAGRTEVARAAFGVDDYDRGTVEVDGKPVRRHDVQAAIRAGLGLVPEDRKGQGLVLTGTVGQNLELATLANRDPRRLREIADRLRVKGHVDQPVRELSGGNQQKVVIGKWLLADPKVLILDEPTRGVDVGAKVEIYELVNRMTAQGRAVLLVSSDLPEVIGMSDRVVVMAHGRVAGELPKGATQDQVMALAVQESTA
ncbi:ribose transport system ATP-binding protein [Lentzea fradiae]|uniref:Ribose transport system ATP-binding protein n=1 Tax=Lentzea fradiae TaxID=200378 RepID=A0A1G8DAH6_9PSEU|nr:sugar ABC transporter ATP-binding protein [Lentzea fradiae]SDH54692.1 ribose transport system ATP-binding protein [Lentzea fradiae]